MEVHVTAETAKKLKDLAATSGRAPDDIVETQPAGHGSQFAGESSRNRPCLGIGLAVLVSLAAARTGSAIADPTALNDGYHVAFLVAAALTAIGLALATRLPDRIVPR